MSAVDSSGGSREDNADANYEDMQLSCTSCRSKFTFTLGEQRFFKDKGFAHRPKRCRSCRLARKDTRTSAPRPTPSPAGPKATPDSLPKYSLPIPTVLGLIVEADRTGFSSAVDNGRVVYARSNKPVVAGCYVSFTKSTIKGDYNLHEVLGPDPPPAADRSLPEMKASVVDTQDDSITLRVHFNNTQVLCAAPSFQLSSGQRVLFTPCWTDSQQSPGSTCLLRPRRLVVGPPGVPLADPLLRLLRLRLRSFTLTLAPSSWLPLE